MVSVILNDLQLFRFLNRIIPDQCYFPIIDDRIICLPLPHVNYFFTFLFHPAKLFDQVGKNDANPHGECEFVPKRQTFKCILPWWSKFLHRLQWKTNGILKNEEWKCSCVWHETEIKFCTNLSSGVYGV